MGQQIGTTVEVSRVVSGKSCAYTTQSDVISGVESFPSVAVMGKHITLEILSHNLLLWAHQYDQICDREGVCMSLQRRKTSSARGDYQRGSSQKFNPSR